MDQEELMVITIAVNGVTLSPAETEAFLMGVVECEVSFTKHYGGDLIEIYDQGRDAGRKLLGIED